TSVRGGRRRRSATLRRAASSRRPRPSERRRSSLQPSTLALGVEDLFHDEGVVQRRGLVCLDVVAHAPWAARKSRRAEKRSDLRFARPRMRVGPDHLTAEGANANGVGEVSHSSALLAYPVAGEAEERDDVVVAAGAPGSVAQVLERDELRRLFDDDRAVVAA